MKTSESIVNIATALAASQTEIKNVVKDATGQFSNDKTKKTYATLAAVIDETKDLLSKNGIVVIQALQDKSMVTRLLHISGEWIESSFELMIEKPTMQGLGSACTYARRYSLAAMLNIAQADDDGQEAEKHPINNEKIDTQKAVQGMKTEQKDETFGTGQYKLKNGYNQGKKLIDLETLYIKESIEKLSKVNNIFGALKDDYLSMESYIKTISIKAEPKLDETEKVPF
jgi:hypothetical protein